MGQTYVNPTGTCTGTKGDDTFPFDAVLNATTNVDRITDFSIPADTIELDRTIFAALSLGTLSANGSDAGAQVLFAQVNAGQALTNADFLVVG